MCGPTDKSKDYCNREPRPIPGWLAVPTLAATGLCLLLSSPDCLQAYALENDALCLACGLTATLLGLLLLFAAFRCTRRAYGWPGLLALVALLATVGVYWHLTAR